VFLSKLWNDTSAEEFEIDHFLADEIMFWVLPGKENMLSLFPVYTSLMEASIE